MPRRIAQATRRVTGAVASIGAPVSCGVRAMNASRLDSWKEIAVYLGRGVRTVQRWEREEGLPVHRLAHEKRGSVYAHREEIDAWWESRRLTLPAAETAPTPESPPRTARPDRVTWTTAATFWPAISSDGRLFAYVSDGGRDGTRPQIWLQQLGGAAVCLTTADLIYQDLSFATADTKLVFTARDDAGESIYEMPTLGGTPRVLRRAARGGRVSPDGQWLAYVSANTASGLSIASLHGIGDRTIATELTNIVPGAWSADGKHVVVRAHPDPTSEPDYWIVDPQTGSASSTGVVRSLLRQGYWIIPWAPAWVDDALVFAAVSAGREGINLWRQRLDPETLSPIGDAERLTRGNEMDWFPTGTNGRIAYVTTHTDQNVWSVPLDRASGCANGPPRRLTRGPGVVGHLSVTSDGRTLAYFAARVRMADVLLRDLRSNDEAVLTDDSDNADRGFPIISPSGSQLAYSTRVPSPRAMRPVFITTLPDRRSRLLSEDCGGRPRQWLDDRVLLIETFGARLNTFVLIDTVTGERHDLIASADRSVTNPRVSPDRRLITFDATQPGGPPNVFVAPLDGTSPVPEASWTLVQRSASHPFWSADGSLLYYLPTIPSAELRNVVKARRVDPDTGHPTGDEFTAFSSNEVVIPVMITGASPVATGEQIIFVLGDFRGDVWTIDLRAD